MDLKIKHKICLTPHQCYDAETSIPSWLIIALIGAGVIIIKDLIN